MRRNFCDKKVSRITVIDPENPEVIVAFNRTKQRQLKNIALNKGFLPYDLSHKPMSC